LRTAPAKDTAMAMLSDWFHLAWEYHNATASKDQIVWKKIDAAVEADIEFTPFQKYVADGKNPEIAAYVDGLDYHVAIVYVDGSNVKCVYSADDGETWSAPVTIAPGSYPALCAIGTKLYCTYIQGGNLYLVISEDGGETWGEAEQINNVEGTVSEEENAVDIHSAGIVWVDTRDGEKEIYFAALTGVNNPPYKPKIEGQTKLKPNIEYKFKFIGIDPDANQIFYYIYWGDNETVVWDGPYNSGTPLELEHTWETKGKFIIKCKVKDEFDVESALATFEITIPRTRFFTLRFLDYFPKAFPILRLLLGNLKKP
ncbi:MAG: sialidase family protein, partial [Candidatus Thermoplasmatota archaeon]|nr:sialidase family protein [Candidatus Thermoplasmatota archaeon]